MDAMYDIIVIGSGPAGYYGAITAARAGKRVALVEKNKLGGTGFRWGCLPVKYMLDRIKKIEEVKEDLGIKIEDVSIYDSIFQKTTADMEGIEAKIRHSLEAHHVDIFFGDGEFVDNHHYKLSDDTLETKDFIIATGTSPAGIKDITIDHDRIISHEEAIQLGHIPKELIIVGGNVEGIEFASLFAHLGTRVTVIEKEETILLGNDADLIAPLEGALTGQGVKLIKGIGAINTETNGLQGKVILEDGQVITGDYVLVTGFRKPNFPRGLAQIGVQTDVSRIMVDDYLRTNIQNIYAIGDINGILGMAHVAISQGTLVLDAIEKNRQVPKRYKSLPRAIFTVGEIAGAGYQEWELQEEGIAYRMEKTKLKDTWRGHNKGHKEDFIKVLLDDKDYVLGIWMYGNQVSELVGSLGLLIDQKVSAKEIRESLYVHPTLSEALVETVIKF